MLAGLRLRIEPGERVLLAGPSGAGKSTLLRAVAGLLLTADVGELAGEVTVDGRAPQARPGQVGLLLQDPTAGVVARTVGRDVAFGLENTGVPREEMPLRVRRALAAARFPYDERRLTSSLSGGETQRLALAGALAMRPRVLLLDEPTSMLDEDNAARVRRAVLDAAAEQGMTLVVVEHHLEPWVGHVDRAVVLDRDGAVVADGPPEQVLEEQREALAGRGVWVPGLPVPRPLPVDPELVAPRREVSGRGVLVRARDIVVRHRSPFAGAARRAPGTTALDGVGCEVRPGETLGLVGPSGAGKSTLLGVLAGLVRPDAGTAEAGEGLGGLRDPALSRLASRELAARLAWVPQVAEHGLVSRTVLQELLVTSAALGLPRAEQEERARALLDVLGLSQVAHVDVHHLSGGEQRRVVVAAALVHGPVGLLLDEPTVGQDRLTWAAVLGVCEAASSAGAGVAVATHDVPAADLLAGRGRTLALDGGRVRREAA